METRVTFWRTTDVVLKMQPKTSIELENIELKKALQEAEFERDIFKKVLSIFSKKDR